MVRNSRRLLAGQILAAMAFATLSFWGCRKAAWPPQQPASTEAPLEVKVALYSYGLPRDYARYDDDDCTTHVIGYRFLVWLDSDSLAAGFNTTPSCRPASGEPLTTGNLRLLVFDGRGKLKVQRDLPYGADGGPEIVGAGEAYRGPGNTLLVRLEESSTSKSGVLLLNPDLLEVARFDRFLETPSIVDRSLVFQQGVVWSGPRTYDIVSGAEAKRFTTTTEDWPVGTMDRKVGSNGAAFALCTQELSPGRYERSNIIQAGAQRHCTLGVLPSKGAAWEAELEPDEVVEILGIASDGSVLGIVRGPKQTERLMSWTAQHEPEILPWFPAGFSAGMQSMADLTLRYQGYGRKDNRMCGFAGYFCRDDTRGRLMIFDRQRRDALVDRPFAPGDRAALSPDGLHYATLAAGELQAYALPAYR